MAVGDGASWQDPAVAENLTIFSAAAEVSAVFSAAVGLAMAVRVMYRGYSTVKELLAGDFPSASQSHLASSLKTTSRDTCTLLVAGSYILYALDPVA
jgi:hypothetical protein